MAGPENFATMLNNMPEGGTGRLAELFGALTPAGIEAYAQFCNRATPEQSKMFAAWLGSATSEHVKQAARRLNTGAAGAPSSFLGWLDAVRTFGPRNHDPRGGTPSHPGGARRLGQVT